MALTAEKVEEEALGLSSADRALLAEKLLASLTGEPEPGVERAHLDEIRRRRQAVGSGQSPLIEGDDALRRARAAVRQ